MRAQATLWTIGKKDLSSLEFPAVPRKKVEFKIGASDWSKDWPGEQQNGSVYDIGFDLKDPPSGSYALDLSLLTYLPRIPALRITVNGQSGVFYLDPKVSTYLGDQRSIFDPHYSSQERKIALPARLFVQGNNKITIECIPAHPPLDAPANISGIHYDYLALEHSTQVENPVLDVEAEPTVFYVQGTGGLSEQVDVTLRTSGPLAADAVMLTMRGKSIEKHFEAIASFGEERVTLDMPEWSGTVPLQISLEGTATFHRTVPASAARKWTVHVAPHTHVDVGYTDFQGKVAEAQARALDEAADMIAAHPEFRFATDGSWNLEQFLNTRSPEDQKRVLDLVRDRKITVPAQYFNLLTGYASLTELYHSLYATHQMAQEQHIPFDYANTTDVPTFTGAYPSVLAAAGLKYWVVGGNNDRAPILSHEDWSARSPFWYQGPDGKKVLFWYSRCYEQVMFVFGLPPTQSAIRESLPIFLQTYSTPEYKPDSVLVYGTQPENTDLYAETATFATEWNRQYAYPKLMYSTFPAFFGDLEKRYGAVLPTYSGDMGPYWEDGIGSDAANVSVDRSNQQRVLSAEALAAVSYGLSPAFRPAKAQADDAWRNLLLFNEHTWTAGDSVERPDDEEVTRQLAVKDNRATQATFEINDSLDRSMSQIVNSIHVPEKTIVVFNSQSWKRDLLVDVDLYGEQGIADAETKQPVELEILSEHKGFVRARFLAKDVPSVGYRCFSLAPHRKEVVKNATTGDTIENEFYRVQADAATGSLQSVFDKKLQRELVDQASPYRFGQYLYVTGGDGKTRMINPFRSLVPGDLAISAAGKGKLLSVTRTPWGAVMRLQSSAPNTPLIETEITLYDRSKRIDVDVHVQKTETTAKEAVYIAFPVASSTRRFSYANQQAVVTPGEDTLKGGSLEWFTVQQWMAVRGPSATVAITPVDAPLASFGDINRGQWPGDFKPASSTVFSYAMNNYWHTNYRAAQGGDFTFRYAITSTAAFEPDTYDRLGREAMTPFEVDHVLGQDKVGNPARPLPMEATSLLELDQPNVKLAEWKVAEDGNGTILRLQETAGKATKVMLRLHHMPLAAVQVCNAMEDCQGSAAVHGDSAVFDVGAREVKTVRLLRGSPDS